MTEHLAFQQFLTERGAVYRYEILLGTLTIIMYGLRKDSFPVPVSPVSNTGTSVPDTFRASETASFNAFESPKTESKEYVCPTFFSSFSKRTFMRAFSTARLTSGIILLLSSPLVI